MCNKKIKKNKMRKKERKETTTKNNNMYELKYYVCVHIYILVI